MLNKNSSYFGKHFLAHLVWSFVVSYNYKINNTKHDLIAETLPKVLLSLKKLPKQSAVFLYIILDTISTSLGLSIVDYFMDNVSATDISIIIISFLLSLFGIKDIDKKPDV